jgi:hypothetical protein
VTIAIRIFIPLDAPLLYLESLKVSFKFIGGRKSYQRFRMTVAQNCIRALLYETTIMQQLTMYNPYMLNMRSAPVSAIPESFI